jgi:DeoR/GlpR family transcriptional regulator of sugar metabolism
MNSSNRPLSERQELTIRLIEESGGASVRELSEMCGVSEMTIRRDLDVLESQGIIRRHHGGAIATRRSTVETPYAVRSGKNRAAKQRIAEHVVREIRDGQSLALGNGSTPHELALLLSSFKNLNVLTPSLRTALVLAQFPSVTTVVPGLTVRGIEASMVGAEAVDGINQFYFDLAVIGAAGVDPIIGITEYNSDEVAVTRAILKRSARSIVVADGSKLGSVATVVASNLKDVAVIVTSDDADPKLVSELRTTGVEVELV